MVNHEIRCRYFSQEDLLGSGCLDIRMAMDAAEEMASDAVDTVEDAVTEAEETVEEETTP